ncbi:MAG: bifunctional diguanylate cyclase/phosphodiesterase [Oricola sp.]
MAILRLFTIASSGFGAASLAFCAMVLSGSGLSGPLDFTYSGMAVATLAALGSSGFAHAFFAESAKANRPRQPDIHTDPMTTLLTRSGLEREIARLFRRQKNAKVGASRWMLVSIEIDAFRDINDTHGRETGDTVLRTVASRLTQLVGRLGPVARIGGSEFAYVVEMSRNDRELQAVMTAVIDELAKPINTDTKVITVFCTAGLVEMKPGDLSVVKTLRRTNLARATARSGGLGNWAIYHPEMTRTASYRKWIEAELPHALCNGEFDLVYQPQVNSLTGRTVGYEALLRWTHPQKGVIPPAEFVRVAEKRGLIGRIGKWVLQKACEDAKQLPPDVSMAVNVSPKQLESPLFVTELANIFEETGTDPRRVEIEITENILISDHETVRETFEQIRRLGCTIAIDDFGTGYSNLSYLADLPFNKLKLDRSLVARLGEKENGGAVVTTIVNLAHALDVTILAEGVETEGQAVLLRAAGCSQMQGYHFGKPLKLTPKVTPLASNGQRIASITL